MREIRIADDFSPTPAGRYRNDGPRSGEAFREDYLVPLLKENEIVVVYLDGGEGYGQGFLEEAFGGLIRVCNMDPDDLRNRLIIETDDEEWRKDIIRCISV